MKKIISMLVCIICLLTITNSQTITNFVISSAGNSNFTIGEVIIAKTNGNLYQGFHQPKYSNDIISIVPTLDNIIIYPNPVINELNIISEKTHSYKVYNMNGIEILNGNNKTIDFTNQISGIYIIYINNIAYKILKQ